VKPPEPHRDQRLQQLKSRPLRIGIRMEKRQQARLAGRKRNRSVQRALAAPRARANGTPLPGEACDEQDRHHDQDDVHGGAQGPVCAKIKPTHTRIGSDRGENGLQQIMVCEILGWWVSAAANSETHAR